MTGVSSRGRCLRSGTAGSGGVLVAHMPLAVPWGATCLDWWVRVAPRRHRDAGRWCARWLVDHGGLPAKAGELARERDGGHAGGLAAAGEVAVAAMQALLGAPGDRDHARVLAGLAALERAAHARRMSIGVRGLDQQPAGVPGAGLGDRPQPPARPGGVLAGHDPQVRRQLPRAREALEVPTSAAIPAAERVSSPRKQRSRAITGANALSGQVSSMA